MQPEAVTVPSDKCDTCTALRLQLAASRCTCKEAVREAEAARAATRQADVAVRKAVEESAAWRGKFEALRGDLAAAELQGLHYLFRWSRLRRRAAVAIWTAAAFLLAVALILFAAWGAAFL